MKKKINKETIIKEFENHINSMAHQPYLRAFYEIELEFFKLNITSSTLSKVKKKIKKF